MNVNKELIEKALELKPQDKILLIEALVESLDKPCSCTALYVE